MKGSSQPTCTVCIANFNGIGFIDDCIQSVLNQECPFPVEIIVHDDASTDDSVAYIRQHYPQVKLIASTENVGFCISNNRMVSVAQGDYILLLNNDAALFKDALHTLHAAATNSSDPAILGLPQYDAATGELIDMGSLFDPFLNPIPNLDPGRSEVGMIIGACLWLPRSMWNDLGGFPEWFGSLAEDMLLCCAATLHGYRVIALPDSGFKHWVGKSLGGGKLVEKRLATKASRRALSERNKNYVMFLTYPGFLLFFLLPLHVLLLVGEGMVIAVAKKDWRLFSGIYLNAIYSLWRQRTILAHMRRTLQARKKCSLATFCKPFVWLPHKLIMLFKYGMPKIGKT